MSGEFLVTFLCLNIVFLHSKQTVSQDIEIEKYQSENKNENVGCRSYQELKSNYNSLQQRLNLIKLQCQREYCAFSQDIREDLFISENKCSIRNSNRLLRRVAYIEDLISRITDICQTNTDKIPFLSSPSTIESLASTSSVIAKAKQTIVTTTSAAADTTKITTPTKSTKTKTTELFSTTEDIPAFTSSSLTAGLNGKVSLSTSIIEITETTAASIRTEPTSKSTSLKTSYHDLSSSGLSTSYKIPSLSTPSITEPFVSTSSVTATTKQTKVTTTTAAAEITKTTPTKSNKTTTAELFSSTEGIGTWSIWGPWSICGVTCGTSVHSRYRTCNKTSKNKSNCVGNIKETKECTTTPCLVYGTWTTWQSWTTCDVTCGGGRQDRSRTCVKVATTDLDCMGRSTQQQTCNKWECPNCSKVCTIGTLNRECDACECETNIQGRVKNSNGGFLNNVSISHESTPYKHLTTTKIDGSFQLNNVCRQQYIIFQRSGYQDTIVKITTSDVFVTMHLKKYPVITTQPKTRLRLEGESVEFCCNATGNPPITSYEWLKNGNLVNDSFHTGGTSLILKDLKFADSGTVICRANSPIGAVFSNSVFLSVRENPDDFCVDAYESHEIDLPSDCIQEDTNSIKYDIGNCLPKACRKNNTNKEEKCSVDKRFCCSPSGREKRIIQCSGYSFPLYVTTSCKCGDCEDIAITVHGQAIGETKGPLCFGTIQIEGETVGTTGLVGDFSFNIPRGVTRIAVKFIDDFFNTFLETLKVIELNEEIYGRIYVHVKMIEKATPIPINVSLSNTLQLGKENGKKSIASITIKPNSIFFQNGSVYNGVAKASVNFFDPRNSSNIQNAPGEFISIDQEGQTRNLQTFGVFSLSLQDQSGSNSLQIVGETQIELDQAYFKYASIGNLADAKLWGLNPETGIWEEQATLTVQKSKRKKRNVEFLVGTIQISAIVMWNVDGLFDSIKCYFKTQVFEGDTKITNYNVRVIYRTDRDISNVIRYQERDVRSDEAVLVSCRNDGPLTVYIEVEKDGKKVLVDPLNSGLSSYVQSLIKYQVLEANRTVSAEARISTTGPFYDSLNANFENVFRFKLDKKDYSMKVLNSDMTEAIRNKYPGNEVWYPPLNSFRKIQLEYRTCFIKIGTVNANSNLLFRVKSFNNASTLLGIHEKGLTNGSTCIEYRCSVQNPVLDPKKADRNDFARELKTYTFVQILPVGQVCTVSSEVGVLRNQEKTNMDLSSTRTNVGRTVFEANIPDTECDGLYFHKSSTFEEISNARKIAIQECNKGVHDSLSETETDMTADVGLALTFACL